MSWDFEIDESVEIDAAPGAVWERVSDHEGTPSWVKNGLSNVRIIEPGETVRGGMNAVRGVKFMGWPEVRERIVKYEPPDVFHYSVFTGMPQLSEHLGEVRVTALGPDRAQLRWYIQFGFNPWHPLSLSAPLFIAIFRRVIAAGCRELKRQMEVT